MIPIRNTCAIAMKQPSSLQVSICAVNVKGRWCLGPRLSPGIDHSSMLHAAPRHRREFPVTNY